METLRVALLQLTSCGADQAANLVKGEAYCRRARAMGADLALFPELWNVGYLFARPTHPGVSAGHAAPGAPEDLVRAPELWHGADGVWSPVLREAVERWRAQAIGRDSAFVRRFRALARELGMAIAVTYLERWEGAPRNTLSLIDRHGAIVLTYAKVHTCDFDLPEAACTPGDDFPVGDLDTAQGPVRVGAMICYDREFPESARILMLRGAELVLTPNACWLDGNRLAQFRARAFENMVGVAMANYAAPQQNGHSIAFDGIAHERSDRDMLLVEAGEEEGVFLAPFDLDRLRAYRQREIWGNTFRRPHRYGLLTAPDVAPPFVRVNRAGERYDPTKR